MGSPSSRTTRPQMLRTTTYATTRSFASWMIVDLMGRACGLAYADVAADMEWHDLSGVRVPIASPAALLRMKDTYRPQDAIDRSFLQQILERRRGHASGS